MPSSGSFNSLLLPNMAKFIMFFILNILARYPCRQCLEFQSAAVLVKVCQKTIDCTAHHFLPPYMHHSVKEN